MTSATLAAAAIVDAAIAVLLFYVGRVVAARKGSPPAKRALQAFGAWWDGLAFTVLVNAVKEAVAALGFEREMGVVPLLDLLQYASIVALCIAVWGLLYYLIYLFTGNERWRVPLATFYAAYALVGLAFVWRMDPAGVAAGKWFVTWAYTAPAAGGAFLVVLTLLLLLPQIVGAALYLRAARHATTALSRYRIRLVSWALILWLGITLVAPFVQLGRFEWWQAGGRLVGLVAALAILMAYRPPPAIARRLTEAS